MQYCQQRGLKCFGSRTPVMRAQRTVPAMARTVMRPLPLLVVHRRHIPVLDEYSSAVQAIAAPLFYPHSFQLRS